MYKKSIEELGSQLNRGNNRCSKQVRRTKKKGRKEEEEEIEKEEREEKTMKRRRKDNIGKLSKQVDTRE